MKITAAPGPPAPAAAAPRREPVGALAAAAALALVAHGVLGLALEAWHLPRHRVIPVEQARKFELKRVRLRPEALEPPRPAVNWKALPLARDAAPRPVPLADNRAIEQALQSVRPQVEMPAADAPPQVPLMDAGPGGASAVETLIARPTQEQAMIREEIGKLSAATLAPGDPGAAPAPLSGMDAAGAGVRGGQGGPATPGAGVPEFDDLRAQFRNAGAPGPRLPEPVLVRLPSDVVFDFDSERIRSSALPLLQQALNVIARYPRARVQVEGHTDTFGTDDYNQSLSQRRAANVADWLRRQLPAPKQDAYSFTARGYGKTRPLVNPRGSIAQQERNRRVELIIQPLEEARQ